MRICKLFLYVVSIVLLFQLTSLYGSTSNDMLVGISKIDITPKKGNRLAGYSQRNAPFDKVDQNLWAKAIVIGSDDNLSIFLTVDLVGIPIKVTKDVESRLSDELRTTNFNLGINASHTHSGPMIGNIIAEVGTPLSTHELMH